MTVKIEERSWAARVAYKRTEQSVALGKRIAQVRKKRKLNQSSLADKLDVSRGTVVQYEQGYINPPLPMLHKLAEVLGEPPEFIAFGVRAKEEVVIKIEVAGSELVIQT